jgi:hypothetical protein
MCKIIHTKYRNGDQVSVGYAAQRNLEQCGHKKRLPIDNLFKFLSD